MKIKKRFLIFFITFVLSIIIIIAAISILFFYNSYDILIHATNTSLIPIMAKRMFFKLLWGFGIVILLVTVISIPAGIFLSHVISQPYLNVFQNLSNIAQKRLKLDKSLELNDNELTILQKYLNLLIVDLKKIKDYEKVIAWKDGARLLMHEIKNPLTPLKLSAQSLSIQPCVSDDCLAESNRILSSCNDIEKILSLFKELVNIDFGPKEIFDIIEYLNTIFNEINTNFVSFPVIKDHLKEEFFVLSEKTLVKMLVTNLIQNGIEANARGFSVSIKNEENIFRVEFITGNRKIEEPSKIFKLGYSLKGEKRGFGLFLCKKISSYLDLDLNFKNSDRGVIFSITFTRSHQPS